ncbi:hypothetical protein JAAARDRAFT_182669 [Jaapia argillacea MUCL 33604]|uniref:Uncharacterized protein n=1 Tax=Jaapia argillacea MUCL 33604 TaxID=933084 RepID=A0A067PJ97_9AGAM|nr:hypothetical protein JAAARDRAFT_182669 [Jaapia argillacea MUCL 33604]
MPLHDDDVQALDSSIQRLCGISLLLTKSDEARSVIDSLESTTEALHHLLLYQSDAEAINKLLPKSEEGFQDVLDFLVRVQRDWIWSKLLSKKERAQCHRLLVALSQIRDQVPRSLLIQDVVPTTTHIGGGGFGDVFEGSYKNEKVAVKVIRLHLGPDIKKFFMREALMWFALNHEHVVPLIGIVPKYDAGPSPRSALVSPLYQNGNLLDYVKKKHPTIDHLDSLLGDVARGLEYVHERGIVHGDLRAVNVLVDDAKRAQISDFGLAYLFEMTQSTNVRGNLLWMAPELHAPSSSKDDRTPAQDVYSFGMVCIEVYTGKAPYGNLNHAAALACIRDFMSPPRPANPSGECLMSDQLWNVAQMCWKPSPKDRPTIRKVIELLPRCHPPAPLDDTSPSRSATLRPADVQSQGGQPTTLDVGSSSLGMSAEFLAESPTNMKTPVLPSNQVSPPADPTLPHTHSSSIPSPLEATDQSPAQPVDNMTPPIQTELPSSHPSGSDPPLVQEPSSPRSQGQWSPQQTSLPHTSSSYPHASSFGPTTSASQTSDNDNPLELFNILASRNRAVTQFSESSSGPDNSKRWSFTCIVNGVEQGNGCAHNKREAEYAAARQAIHNLGWDQVQTSSPPPMSGTGKNHLAFFNEIATQRRLQVVFPPPVNTGSQHVPRWEVVCIVDGVEKGRGTGKSKQSAKDEAAREACRNMGWTS